MARKIVFVIVAVALAVGAFIFVANSKCNDDGLKGCSKSNK